MSNNSEPSVKRTITHDELVHRAVHAEQMMADAKRHSLFPHEWEREHCERFARYVGGTLVWEDIPEDRPFSWPLVTRYRFKYRGLEWSEVETVLFYDGELVAYAKRMLVQRCMSMLAMLMGEGVFE